MLTMGRVNAICHYYYCYKIKCFKYLLAHINDKSSSNNFSIYLITISFDLTEL